MNDRRRALLAGGGFPVNYIFKQGLGFRKDIEYAFTSLSPNYCNVTKDSIYLEGWYGGSSSDVASAVIYIGEKIEYNSKGQLLKNAIPTNNFKKIYFHFNVVDSNNTRAAFINLINCDKLPNGYIVREQETGTSYKPTSTNASPYYYSANRVHNLIGVTTANGEYTISLDISAINETMISLWSGNFSGKKLTVYDIWLE